MLRAGDLKDVHEGERQYTTGPMPLLYEALKPAGIAFESPLKRYNGAVVQVDEVATGHGSMEDSALE